MDEGSFRGHAAWVTLETVEGLLRGTETWIDQGDADLVALRWLTSTVRSHADPGDTVPYPATLLDGIQGNLAQIESHLAIAESTKELSNLRPVHPYTDSLTQQVAWLPPVTNRDPARHASRTFVEYRAAVEEAITRLAKEEASLRELLDQRADEVGSQQAAIEASVAAFQTSIDQLSAKITQDETRLDTALTNNNDAFTTQQTNRQERFSTWLGEKERDFDSEVVRIKNDASTHLNDITKLHEDVEKVSGKAAAAILAKDYGSYSTREWVTGVIAYALGFILLVSLGVYLIHTVADVSKDESVSWQYVALKLGLTVTAIAASGVAFQFGAHALSRANTNKRVQLELGTIGTFLADVEDEEAVQAAKVDFVNRMFGRAWDEKAGVTGVSGETVNVSAVGQLIDSILKAQGK